MGFFNKIGGVKKYVDGRVCHKRKGFSSSFNSYKIAEKYLKSNTAVVYSHLYRTNNFNIEFNIAIYTT